MWLSCKSSLIFSKTIFYQTLNFLQPYYKPQKNFSCKSGLNFSFLPLIILPGKHPSSPRHACSSDWKKSDRCAAGWFFSLLCSPLRDGIVMIQAGGPGRRRSESTHNTSIVGGAACIGERGKSLGREGIIIMSLSDDSRACLSISEIHVWARFMTFFISWVCWTNFRRLFTFEFWRVNQTF